MGEKNDWATRQGLKRAKDTEQFLEWREQRKKKATRPNWQKGGRSVINLEGRKNGNQVRTQRQSKKTKKVVLLRESLGKGQPQEY